MTLPSRTARFALSFLFGLAAAVAARAGSVPVLDAITPSGANVDGGNSVLLTGSNLASVTAVTFDGIEATILRQDANSIYVTAPAHAIGNVVVEVSESGRRPAGTPGVSFSYSDDWDAGRDFSAVQNPIGAWSFGVAPTLGQAMVVDAAPGIEGCLDTWSGDNLHPVIGRNRTGATCNMYSWSWPAGKIGIHPDNTPEYGIIRFTAPDSALYEVDGQFLCIDTVVACTVHVVIVHNNTTTKFSRNISASFAPELFSFAIELAAGDTLDFSQGNGGNHYNFDQMVLDARVRRSLFGDDFEAADQP